MKTLALDIGGANIKAAHSGGAWTVPFALWKHPGQLIEKLGTLIKQVGHFDRVAVTMTAELCDCFATKRDGVNHVLKSVESLSTGRPLFVWTVDGRFVPSTEAREQPLRCAAANWHALASYVGTLFPKDLSLLIDTGSTTTDVVRVQDGKPTPIGLTDMDRLASGELVYLGATRTPVTALGPTVSWNGQHHGLMAEPFATTADVFLLTGHLPENAGRTDTADGRPFLRRHAAARLARMIGGDLEMLTEQDAARLAEALAQTACHRVAQAITRVLENRTPARLIVSGSGSFLPAAAAQPAVPGLTPTHLATLIGEEASAAACAYALVQLLDHHTHEP